MDISVVRERLGEKEYWYINQIFPSIEGNMFLKLDGLLTALHLEYGKNNVKINNWYYIFEISIYIKNFYISIFFNKHQKRICINFTNAPKGLTQSLKKKLNIHSPEKNNHHRYCYDFKYTTKNCNRIIKIIMESFSYSANI